MTLQTLGERWFRAAARSTSVAAVVVMCLGAAFGAAAEEPRRRLPQWLPMTPVDPPPAPASWNPLPVRTETPVMPGAIVQTPQFSGQGPWSTPPSTEGVAAVPPAIGDQSLARRLADATLASGFLDDRPRPAQGIAPAEQAATNATRALPPPTRGQAAPPRPRRRPLVVEVTPAAPSVPSRPAAPLDRDDRVASLPAVPPLRIPRPRATQPETSSRPATKEQADFETWSVPRAPADASGADPDAMPRSAGPSRASASSEGRPASEQPPTPARR
ncbi:MAG: hypothetical protein NUV77_23500 [Thermoguttaceae bacterium]|jgi:hypothetical protein|nr:hypothetical protein [Thermoguttaceae bacterium]